MSQPLSLNNYHKRKYITTPKKSYFSPKGKNRSGKNKSQFANEPASVNNDILKYFSSSGEKRMRLTPESETESGAGSSKILRVRKDLFAVKDKNGSTLLSAGNNAATASFDHPIVVSDDDDDGALTLVYKRENKKLNRKIPDVPSESGSKCESLNKSSHVLKKTINPYVASCSKTVAAEDGKEIVTVLQSSKIKAEEDASHFSNLQKSTTDIKSEFENQTSFPEIIREVKLELEKEIENKTTVGNFPEINSGFSIKADADSNSQNFFSSKVISETKQNIQLEILAQESEKDIAYYNRVSNEVIVFQKSPSKTPKKYKDNIQVRGAETFISPGKTVVDVRDLVESVHDINWWEDEDFEFSKLFKNGDNRMNNNNNITDQQNNNTSSINFFSDVKVDEQNGSTNAENIKDGSQKVNQEKNKIGNSSGDKKIENSSKQNSDSQMKSDLLHYIISTPPAIIAWQTLFTHSDYQNIYKNYTALPIEEKLLYSRLFQRKYDWLRLEQIKYGFIPDKNISLSNLASIGFVKFFDVEKEDLSVTLNQMNSEELKRACDLVKVKKGRREDMINNILKVFKTQTMLNFCKSQTVNKNILKIREILPKLVKLEENPRKLFYSFLLISSYPLYKSKDDDRMKMIVDLLYRLDHGQIKELDIPLLPVPIFKSLAKFSEYETSVDLVDRLLEAKKEKQWQVARELVLHAKLELNIYLHNEVNIRDLEQMPDYLRKYTSGSNYVYALSEGIEVLKKNRDSSGVDEVIECLQLLLSQRHFRRGKRASWRCELAMILERQKEYEQVFLILKDGLVEEHLSPLGKTLLVQRCEMLIKKKHGLSVPQKNDLGVLSEMQPYRFTKNTITASEMPNVTTSKKQMWKRETADGHEIMGVEQIVLKRYRSSEGSYTDGCHDEGNIMVNLVLCAFWSEIYAPLEGMFHVRLQRQPIDWGASAFYRNRSKLIKDKIEVYKQSGVEGIMSAINEVVLQFSGALSVISWDLFKLERLPDIKKFLNCLGVEPFLKFSDYLLQSYKERSSGLPDLTLWNVNTMKCLFVEVKGPTDKLSPKQILWLQKMNEFDIPAEVCHVRTLHTGNRP